MIIEAPISLGGLLEEVDYAPAPLEEVLLELRSMDGILGAEFDLPTENLVRPLQETVPGCTAGRDAAPDDLEWAPRLVGLFDIPQPAPTGAGIRVGHIDTGYTQHLELNVDEAVDIMASANTIDGSSAVDPMPGGTSHGTATATVIASRPGSTATTDRGQDSKGITGIAPGATIVPVRALLSVAAVEIPYLFPSSIAQAIHHCIENDCHIISMSFGGIMSQAVRDALQIAYDAQIILCAAAGNCVGFVVEPAALPQVIACGGIGISTASGQIHLWPGTSSGPKVAISAPSENVWVGDWIDGLPVVRPGEGTSFAAPHVAGAAALWLEHHGRATLIDKYKDSGLPLGSVFEEALKRSANIPPGWHTTQNGAGILDLVTLLNEPLPTDIGSGPTEEETDVNLIPILANPVEVVVDIDHLIVRDDGEFFGEAEPYLLLTFFTIDGTSARIETTVDIRSIERPDPRLQVQLLPSSNGRSFVSLESRGGHGNLDKVNVGPLELNESGPAKIRIKNSVGVFRRTLEPIPIRLLLDTGDLLGGADILGLPGFVGVHAILAEEDLTPTTATEAAREVIADGIREILEEVFREIDLSDLSTSPDKFVARQAEIEDAAKAAAAAKMNTWELLWGGAIDPDDQLIQAFTIANVLQLGQPMKIENRYQGPHGDWILSGEIRKRQTG